MVLTIQIPSIVFFFIRLCELWKQPCKHINKNNIISGHTFFMAHSYTHIHTYYLVKSFLTAIIILLLCTLPNVSSQN